MISPAQLCWRNRSLPLSQRYILHEEAIHWASLDFVLFPVHSTRVNTDWFDCGTEHLCKIFSESKNWHEAEAACNAEFGHLASISTTEDHITIANITTVCHCESNVSHSGLNCLMESWIISSFHDVSFKWSIALAVNSCRAHVLESLAHSKLESFMNYR